MTNKLRAVPDLPPPRSLIDLAGSEELKVIEEYLIRRFGGEVLSVVAAAMCVYDPSDEEKTVRNIHKQAYVAGLYTGLEEVAVLPPIRRRGLLYSVSVPTRATIATFATSASPLAPVDMRERMEDNDIGEAALSPKVGVLLTTPVAFEPLVDRSYSTFDDSRPSPLHVVQ